ncbi:PREDICTED: acyl-CoA-binding domain-containing protein 3-like isoform X2 [Lupinus angustifolius]|uniref:acyl-CoA-binding domain-containing protein 3-like isoform X2 n=1 Tax=Lupinus angustifolius TaxID=3871 RepID=UPI00092F27C7|nr:PREDICTED: acyl-CoA-binding domain-containing protein 3-like isoform X2 [Lupinus angustifolius]
MYLFLELSFTIALSLLLPLVFIKLLSMTTNSETNEKVDVIGLDRDRDREVTEETVRIVKKVDEFRDKSVLENHIATEIVDVNCESHKILNSEKIDDNDEIEVANLTENPAEESSHEVEFELMECDDREQEVEEVDEILQCDRNCDEIDEYKRNVEVDENIEDDWEGIERSELEKCFGAAVVFVGSKSYANGVLDLSNDVKLKLYGYYKIATHGPCSEPQPMALKFSARSKCKWIVFVQGMHGNNLGK